MSREPKPSFADFVHDAIADEMWEQKFPTYLAILARVRKEYPSRKFTASDFEQHFHLFHCPKTSNTI